MGNKQSTTAPGSVHKQSASKHVTSTNTDLKKQELSTVNTHTATNGDGETHEIPPVSDQQQSTVIRSTDVVSNGQTNVRQLASQDVTELYLTYENHSLRADACQDRNDVHVADEVKMDKAAAEDCLPSEEVSNVDGPNARGILKLNLTSDGIPLGDLCVRGDHGGGDLGDRDGIKRSSLSCDGKLRAILSTDQDTEKTCPPSDAKLDALQFTRQDAEKISHPCGGKIDAVQVSVQDIEAVCPSREISSSIMQIGEVEKMYSSPCDSNPNATQTTERATEDICSPSNVILNAVEISMQGAKEMRSFPSDGKLQAVLVMKRDADGISSTSDAEHDSAPVVRPVAGDSCLHSDEKHNVTHICKEDAEEICSLTAMQSKDEDVSETSSACIGRLDAVGLNQNESETSETLYVGNTARVAELDRISEGMLTVPTSHAQDNEETCSNFAENRNMELEASRDNVELYTSSSDVHQSSEQDVTALSSDSGLGLLVKQSTVRDATDLGCTSDVNLDNANVDSDADELEVRTNSDLPEQFYAESPL